MANLPSFTVTGDVHEIPGVIIGGELSAVTPNARVVFTPNFKGPVVWDGDLFFVKPVSVLLNPDGSIQPVLLLADDAGLNVTGIQWEAQIRIQGSVTKFWFDAPTDGQTVNLATVAQAPGVAANAVNPLTPAALLALVQNSGSDVREALDALYTDTTNLDGGGP